MSYRALCELVEARGWAISLSVEHCGSGLQATDPWGRLRALLIFESRAALRAREPALVFVRLDMPPITLDEAAEAITARLHAAGVF